MLSLAYFIRIVLGRRGQMGLENTPFTKVGDDHWPIKEGDDRKSLRNIAPSLIGPCTALGYHWVRLPLVGLHTSARRNMSSPSIFCLVEQQWGTTQRTQLTLY